MYTHNLKHKLVFTCMLLHGQLPEVTNFFTMTFASVSAAYTQRRRSGKRQRSWLTLSLLLGDRLILHINIRTSSTPAALHVLD